MPLKPFLGNIFYLNRFSDISSSCHPPRPDPDHSSVSLCSPRVSSRSSFLQPPLSPNSLRRGNALWHRNGSITVLEVKEEDNQERSDRETCPRNLSKKHSWPVTNNEMNQENSRNMTFKVSFSPSLEKKSEDDVTLTLRHFSMKGRKLINNGDSYLPVEQSYLEDFHW